MIDFVMSSAQDNEGSSDLLGSHVHPLTIPLTTAEGRAETSHPIFSGSTSGVRRLSCHYSVLMPGQTSHLPHAHEDEELLFVLDGELELLLPSDTPEAARQTPLRRGEFAFYPAHVTRARRAVVPPGASYIVVTWRDDASAQPGTLSFGRFDALAFDPAAKVQREGWTRHRHFSAPTAYLRQFRCHVSTMQPGAGYAVHADPYDVFIVTLTGEIETLGARVSPNSAVFYTAGEPHGIRNPGETPAIYVVFEFHSHRMPVDTAPEPSRLSKLLDPQRWTRKIKSLIAR